MVHGTPGTKYGIACCIEIHIPIHIIIHIYSHIYYYCYLHIINGLIYSL